jgi:hypothetical protein
MIAECGFRIAGFKSLLFFFYIAQSRINNEETEFKAFQSEI